MSEAPFPSSSASGPDVNRRHVLAGYAVILAGVILSVTAFSLVRHGETDRDLAMFQQRSQAVAAMVREGLQRHQETLYALRNLFHYSDEVSRTEFADAAHDLISRQKGVHALEWVARVPGSGRKEFEAAQREEGIENFRFWERANDGSFAPAQIRSDHFPVVFIEPATAGEPAFGFDLRSGTTWPILDRIAGTGELAASGRLPLITHRAGESGYVMELPVYHQPRLATDPDARRTRLRGYILGIFHLPEVLESFLQAEQDRALEVLFWDPSAAPERRLLHFYSESRNADGTSRPPHVADFLTGRHVTIPVTHGGRPWELWIRPSDNWLAQRSHVASWLTLALGLVVTAAIGSFVWEAMRRERWVGRLVGERTAELRAAQGALERDILRRQETERQLSSLISHLPGAAFRSAFDDHFTSQFASDGMLQLTGYSPDDLVSGRVHFADLVVPQDLAGLRAELAAAVANRTAFQAEFCIRDRAGGERHLLVRGRGVYSDDGALRFIEGLATEVTELKKANVEKMAIERKMLAAQKLESLGVLAGGIAHDFNNLLTAMLGNATLARFALTSGSPAAEHLNHIEQAARRAADLCQQMLAYAGKKQLRPISMRLSELVRSTAGLLRVTMHKNIRLELQLDDDLPTVQADAAQLQQIVMNLVINAADAIGTEPGEIRVTTFQQQVDSEYLRTALHAPELPAGWYIGLEVRDTGCGMSTETIERIFEPFFSTKSSGRGLGLAAVTGIVKSHRGALFVESEPGRGARFRLLLQASTPSSESATRAAERLVELVGAALIVDDEPSVCEVLSVLLTRSGMTTTIAASGDEALKIYAAREQGFDLVMLDLLMPGISGEETLRAIRQRNQKQRVVVMTGYTENEAVNRCEALGISAFVRKPFEMSALLEKLRTTLG